MSPLRTLATVAAVLVLTACGSDTSPEPDPTQAEPEATETQAEPEPAEERPDPIELYSIYSGYASLEEGCEQMGEVEDDPWECYADSIEWVRGNEIQINLATPPRFTDDYTDTLAERAANGYYLGTDFAYEGDIDRVTVSVNGVDTESKTANDFPG